MGGDIEERGDTLGFRRIRLEIEAGDNECVHRGDEDLVNRHG
jgi:hypothetical protein